VDRRPLGAALAVAALGVASPAGAGGVVGNGTPQSCTEAALDARLQGGGTVTFNCGGGAVSILITATKTITATTTIDGSGQAIALDGGGARRLFQTPLLPAPITFTLRNLTLRNGRAPDYGGAIRLADQEPQNWTTLEVSGVTFTNNVCDAAGNDVGGGAIYAHKGYLNIRGSTFSGNRGGNGGAIGVLQAIYTVEDSTFVGNSTNASTQQFAGFGGALYADGSSNGTLTVRRSTFRQNTATLAGGAIEVNQYLGASGLVVEDSLFDRNVVANPANPARTLAGAIYHQDGNLLISGSTFTGNEVAGQGGALWLLGQGTGTIVNSTFTGNRANGVAPDGASGLGGAINIQQNSRLTLSHLTIVNNHASWGGGGIIGGTIANSTTTLRASIVAGNTAANPFGSWHNCVHQLVDGGSNIQFPATTHPGNPDDPNCTGTVVIAQPNLAPLGGQGGLTPTMPPNPGSPARDAVAGGCPPPFTDQRGRRRPEGAACDVGAAEGGADFVFADGADSGGLSRWTASQGAVAAAAGAAYAGGFGLQVSVSAAPAWVQDDTPSAEKRYRVRFYVRANALVQGPNEELDVFTGSSGGGVAQLRLMVRTAGGVRQLRFGVRRDDGTFVETPGGGEITLVPGWRAVEVDWRAATAAGANNGTLGVWVEGAPRTGLSGLDNDQAEISSVRWGAVAGVDAGTGGALQLDELESRRETYIGLRPAFGDVGYGQPFWRWIHALYHGQVAGGCGPGLYCPDGAVSREQMAVFLLRSREGADYVAPACAGAPFADVPASSPFCRWVQELVTRGITGGCGGGNYCPTAAATRAQMAVFLLLTREGGGYQPPACAGAPFADVPASSPYCRWIQELVARGITGGCGGGNYCPEAAVTRGQMAVFLATAFALPVPLP
jgi:predicted outer membrane repeat protein